MCEDLMIDVTYHPISVDEELFELSKDSHIHKSFIKPRTKPSSGFQNIVWILITFVAILGLGYLYLPYEEFFNNKDHEKIKVVKKEKIVKKL